MFSFPFYKLLCFTSSLCGVLSVLLFRYIAKSIKISPWFLVLACFFSCMLLHFCPYIFAVTVYFLCDTLAPILKHPDPAKSCNCAKSSHCGDGCLKNCSKAVLSKHFGERPRLHPVAFLSCKLSPAEQNYNVRDWEILAVNLALALKALARELKWTCLHDLHWPKVFLHGQLQASQLVNCFILSWVQKNQCPSHMLSPDTLSNPFCPNMHYRCQIDQAIAHTRKCSVQTSCLPKVHVVSPTQSTQLITWAHLWPPVTWVFRGSTSWSLCTGDLTC